MNANDIKPTHVLGIDIAKATFQVAIASIDEPECCRDASFKNSPEGYRSLIKWINKHARSGNVHACMEATGPYGVELALYLDERLARLSVEQPRRIKAYGACRMMRSKSDPADARMIAHYCASQHPRPWRRPSAIALKIRALSRRIEAIKAQHHAEKTGSSRHVSAS